MRVPNLWSWTLSEIFFVDRQIEPEEYFRISSLAAYLFEYFDPRYTRNTTYCDLRAIFAFLIL